MKINTLHTIFFFWFDVPLQLDVQATAPRPYSAHHCTHVNKHKTQDGFSTVQAWNLNVILKFYNCKDGINLW